VTAMTSTGIGANHTAKHPHITLNPDQERPHA